jgi:hypothetical protein
MTYQDWYTYWYLKLELKGCADLARTTYLDRMENQLIFPFTFYYAYKPFSNSAEQIKWIDELYMNERDRYNVVMIEITSRSYEWCFGIH